MVDPVLLKGKISKIEYHLSRVKRFNRLSLEDFLKDEDARDIAVHNLFVAIQFLIDIITHMVADDELGEMVFVSDAADILHRHGIIDEEYCLKLKKIIGFRNLIAHEYGTIDYMLIYDIIINGLDDIKYFLKSLVSYYHI